MTRSAKQRARRVYKERGAVLPSRLPLVRLGWLPTRLHDGCALIVVFVPLPFSWFLSLVYCVLVLGVF